MIDSKDPSELTVEAREKNIKEEKEANLAKTDMQKKWEQKIVDSFKTPIDLTPSLAASLDVIQEALTYWDDRVGFGTAFAEQEYNTKKYAATLKGYSQNSEYMIELDKKFAVEKIKYLEEALQGVDDMLFTIKLSIAEGTAKRLKIDPGEAAKRFNMTPEEVLIDIVMKTKEFKEDILLDDRAKELTLKQTNLEKNLISAKNTIENVFDNFSKFIGHLSETVSAKMAEIEATSSLSKLELWKTGIAESSPISTAQKIEEAEKKAEEDKRAAEKARREFDEEVAPKKEKTKTELAKELSKMYESYMYSNIDNEAFEEKQNEIKQLTEDLKIAESSVFEKEATAAKSALALLALKESAPLDAAESRMNTAASFADINARKLIAMAQLKGLGDDSLFERLTTRRKLEEQNEAYFIKIKELKDTLSKNPISPDRQKYEIEMKDLEAKQLENLVAIRKLAEQRVSFNLPDGLRVITQNDYLQTIGNEKSYSAQYKGFNVKFTFGDVNVNSERDLINLKRTIENSMTESFNRFNDACVRK